MALFHALDRRGPVTAKAETQAHLPPDVGSRSLPGRTGAPTRSSLNLTLIGLLLSSVPGTTEAVGQQGETQQGAQQQALPSIEVKTEGMHELDGYFPLYWDESAGELWMEVPRLDSEVLYYTGFGSGLGSNDIGLDRGQLTGSRIIEFERVGRKVLMVQPNLRYRAASENPAELGAVRDAFARSVLWGFTVAAETDGRALVPMNEFLIRDAEGLAGRLQPGTYRLENTRSSIYMPMTMNFAQNTELEVELTFARQPGDGGEGGRGGGGGGAGAGRFFEGVADVAATGEAASLRIHHSFVELPDDGYEPRAYDPRSGFGAVSWEDYAAPLGEPMTRRFIRRHRLEKREPAAAVSEPVEPIIYYLDPGVPEPIRSALLDGASWWNQAFEAAGYRDAFRVELLPDRASSHDVRYNVINWVHRSTRGWSTGASVTDPRTGEIIKGVVTLGSLRVRQDYLIAEGLLSPYRTGTETPPELAEWALDRVRRLAAHEVGHTLGLGHNYYASEAGRISVLDYPHPLVTLRPDGSLDYSNVYQLGIGAWDSVAITWGYLDFAEDVDEQAALDSILGNAWERDIRYLTNQDLAAHPRVNQWANGTDAAAELNRMMDVRRVALGRFGENAIRRGTPLAMLEEALVPLYLHHRYQIEAAASAVGGAHYIYAFRGDGRQPIQRASADEQRAALDALLAALHPSELVLPQTLLDLIPPRPSGYGFHRELFPRYTGSTFDAITPAVVAAEHVLSTLLDAERAARLVEQHAIDPDLPGLDEVLDRLFDGTFRAEVGDAYEAEVNRAVQHVVVDRLMDLAGAATMPQVRALAAHRLKFIAAISANGTTQAAIADAAHFAMLRRDIGRFLERPGPEYTSAETPAAPPGAPIGDPGLDWLRSLDPPCVAWDGIGDRE